MKRWGWWALGIAGIAAGALGCLWAAQGVGLMEIEPIACVGECEPVDAPSLTWMLAGALLIAIGIAVVVVAWRYIRHETQQIDEGAA